MDAPAVTAAPWTAVGVAQSASPSSSPSPAAASWPPRRSGFSRPLHPLQLTVWTLMVACVAVYFGLCVPFVPSGYDAEYAAFIAVYLGVFVVGFALFMAVSLSDPYTPVAPDQAEGAALQAQAPGAPLPVPLSAPPPSPPPDAVSASAAPIAAAAAAVTGTALPVASAEPSTAVGLPRCPVCGAVETPTTKHCYLDGRCVDGFDHHCVYLNTCVGRRNYHLFFGFVTSVTTLLVFQLFVTVWLLAHVNDDPYTQAADDSALSHSLTWLILLTILSVLPALCLVGISTLQCFHCYLLATAQSTYGFIVKRRALMEHRRREWEAQQRQWQWQQQQHLAALQQQQQQQHQQPQQGSVYVDSQPGPVILLTERQCAEQAEWLKQQQQNSRNQQHRQQYSANLRDPGLSRAAVYAPREPTSMQPGAATSIAGEEKAKEFDSTDAVVAVEVRHSSNSLQSLLPSPPRTASALPPASPNGRSLPSEADLAAALSAGAETAPGAVDGQQ